MIHVIVRERDATAQATEPITSGSVGLECSFRFSEDWEGLGKVAIFQGSGQIIDVALVGQESCTVPHEVLQQALGHLKIGVYGTGEQGQRVTPTIWADAGRILPGVEPSEIEPTPATQSLVQQILEAAENAEELAQSVRDDADAGEFDGEPGPKGDKGDPGESGLAYYRAIVSSAGTLTMQADMPSPTEIANTFNTGAGPLPLLRLHDQGWFFNDTETFARIYLDLRYSQRHQTGAKYAVFEGTFENRDGSGPCHIWVKGIEANGSTTWTIGKEALGGGDSGAAYFPFSISDSTVTPGTGVTPQAIYQAYTAGKAVFAVIEPELEIDDDQILPLTWINELSGTYSIWFSHLAHPVRDALSKAVHRHSQVRPRICHSNQSWQGGHRAAKLHRDRSDGSKLGESVQQAELHSIRSRGASRFHGDPQQDQRLVQRQRFCQRQRCGGCGSGTERQRADRRGYCPARDRCASDICCQHLAWQQHCAGNRLRSRRISDHEQRCGSRRQSW